MEGKTTKKFLLLLFIAIFFVLFVKNENPNQVNTTLENEPNVYLSYEISLNYGYYAYISISASEDENIRWEFSGSNSYVGIKVMAMTDIEFSNLQNNQTFYYYSLSNGSYYRDSGIFISPSYDMWYFVFLNMDPDEQTTYLTYNIEINNADSSDESILFPIIGTIVGIIIVGGVCAEIETQSKKKREEEILPPTQPLQQQEQPSQFQQPNIQEDLKFCTNCGAPQKLYANFCEKCGTPFSQLSV